MSKTCGHHIITNGCKCCRAIQDKWYGALKKDFDDIESTKYADRPLKVWHNSAFRNTSVEEIQDTLEYYQKASRLLHIFSFENETIRKIWEMHCEGLSRHKIEIAIKGSDISYKQSTIRSIIKQLNREMEDLNNMIIVTRDFNAETDTGIIVESMSKSIYFDTHSRKGRPSPKWFKAFDDYIRPVLQRAKVVIATTDDDQSHILGFAIFDLAIECLEFIYVKDAYRKQRIATMLSKQVSHVCINKNNMTKLGQKILDQLHQHKALEVVPMESIKNEPDDLDKVAGWIKNGIAVKKASFQSAILSGFNAAESQLSKDSHNKIRVPEEMYYTMGGLVVIQNKETVIIPLANVLQVWP